jgi:hypothetical protein
MTKARSDKVRSDEDLLVVLNHTGVAGYDDRDSMADLGLYLASACTPEEMERLAKLCDDSAEHQQRLGLVISVAAGAAAGAARHAKVA